MFSPPLGYAKEGEEGGGLWKMETVRGFTQRIISQRCSFKNMRFPHSNGNSSGFSHLNFAAIIHLNKVKILQVIT